MKKTLYFLAVVLFLGSCAGGSRGELLGSPGRAPWFMPDPYGMLYIPAGSYNMGQSDQDVPFAHYTRSKTVSIPAFYMDQTEIENNEYRQFVEWVFDSIARDLVSETDPETFLIPASFEINRYLSDPL